MSNEEQKAQEAKKAVAAAPEALPVDKFLSEIRLPEESREEISVGLTTLLREYFKRGPEAVRVPLDLVDEMIADLDRKLSQQMNAVLHHPDFQKLESAWRSLKFLVDQTDFSQNVKIEMMDVRKQELFDDFEDAADLTTSGLYKQVYTKAYATFGAAPYAMMVGNFEFGPGTQDILLLQHLASVATMAHAPFISAVSPEMFGLNSFSEMPNVNDLHAVFDTKRNEKWRSFREAADARNVGLVLPRFLLRVPYGKTTIPIKSFNFQEEATADDRNYLWGNAAFAFATRVTDSFARYRICSNIIGPQGGGTVENLPLTHYEAMGNLQTKIPTEIIVSDPREFELAEEGFIALTMRTGSDNAAFFSANSCQKSKRYPDTEEGKRAELNYKLGTQLPYTFIVSRLAHYIKVLQRENIGATKTRGELEQDLNDWLKQYVCEMDNPSPAVRARRPLRRAQIVVSDVAGDPGWYKVEIKVQPFFKYSGAYFELSLVGKLDKKQ